MKAPPGVTLALVALAAAAAPIATAQVPLRPAPRAVGFPPTLAVMVGVSSYGDRARSDSGPGTSEFTYTLGAGPIVSARLQSPLGRRFGIHVGGGFTYRSQRVDRNGSPLSTINNRVASVRAEGGLLFRFKPAAPIYFGGAVVYYRHGAPPVLNQQGGAMSETGAGLGIGYDFGRKPGSNLAGRIEYWSYFVGPNTSGLGNGVTAKSSARDGALTIGVTYHLRVGERRGS